MNNIKLGDIYWMPASTYLNKRAKDTKVSISKIGSKFIYAKSSTTEYKFTFESKGTLRLVNNMCSGKAYSEEQWEKQKLIIELNNLTQKFKQDFLQINNSTDFKKYQDLVRKMEDLSQRVLDHD